ncbi:MAG: (deoxy)nucleoside triphosphate pyrophosphohydrolase [Terriglobales bacterium]
MVQHNRLLICQRTQDQPMPLKWEFPGGKIEPGEQPQNALIRELEEELGVLADIGEEVVRLQHEYANNGVIELQFFLVHEWKGEITNRIFRSIRWVHQSDLPRYDFLDADRRLVQDIASGIWPQIFADEDRSG